MKYIVCIALLCALFCITTQADDKCTPTVFLAVRDSSTWTQGGLTNRFFDFNIININRCSLHGVVLTLTLPESSYISTAWNYDTYSGTVTGLLSSIAPGEAYTSSGFLLVGDGTPHVTVQSSECTCPQPSSDAPADQTPHYEPAPVEVEANGECTAKAELQDRIGAWNTDNQPHRLYDLRIVNTGSCVLTAIYVQFTLPQGAELQFPVNFHPTDGAEFGGWVAGKVGGKVVFNEPLAPGANYDEAAFVVRQAESLVVAVSVYRVETVAGGHSNSHHARAGTTVPTTAPTTAPTTKAPTTAPTAAPTTVPKTYYNLGMKLLVLTPTITDLRCSVATMALDALAIPYSIFAFDELQGAPLVLNTTDGTGLYYGIVATMDTFGATEAQLQQLANYQIKYNVKWVTLYTYPYPTAGVSANYGGLVTDSSLYFAPAASNWTKGYATAFNPPISGIYYYPADIVDATLAAPALYVQVGNANRTVAAFVTLPDGRRQLQFFFDQATWSLHSVVLGQFWAQWVTSGIYPGMRRIIMNCQIDDLYMNTGMYDTNTKDESETEFYRMVANDVVFMATYQTQINARLAAGSNVTVTWGFNGAAVIEAGGYTTDALYLKMKQYVNSFEFETHTWDHEYLDALTYAQAMTEMTKNVDTAKNMFGTALTHERWSGKSMIQPSISGMFNGNALKAIYDFGVRYLVGDNSRAELVPAITHHGRYTTVADNGFAGLYIIPRHATNVYYDNSLPVHMTNQYNDRNSAYWGKSLTSAEIYDIEAMVNGMHLLALRHDPFMFHQANLRVFTQGSKSVSLLSLWMDAVVNYVIKYSSLPIKSYGQDELAKLLFLEREKRDTCGFAGTFKVAADTKQIVGFTATSTQACRYAVTGAAATASTILSSEAYGPDTTLWMKMPGNNAAVTVTLTTPIKL